MAETYSAGIVTAYGAAVRGGYTGTYEQWCQDMAQLGDNVSEVREKAAQVEQTAQSFTQTIIPAAIQSVENEGTAQIGAVEAAGASQVQAVETAGTTQTGNVNAAGAAQVQAVNDEGVLKVGAVEAAGAAQVQAVEAAGTDAEADIDAAKSAAITALQAESTTQQAAIQQKGEDVLKSIPEDYTDLTEDVSDLKSAINNIEENYNRYNDFNFKYRYKLGALVSTGAEQPSTTRIITPYVKTPKGTKISVASGYKYRIYAYSTPNVDGYDPSKGMSGAFTTEDYEIDTTLAGYYLRYMVAKSDDATITDIDAVASKLSIISPASDFDIAELAESLDSEKQNKVVPLGINLLNIANPTVYNASKWSYSNGVWTYTNNDSDNLRFDIDIPQAGEYTISYDFSVTIGHGIATIRNSSNTTLDAKNILTSADKHQNFTFDFETAETYRFMFSGTSGTACGSVTNIMVAKGVQEEYVPYSETVDNAVKAIYFVDPRIDAIEQKISSETKIADYNLTALKAYEKVIKAIDADIKIPLMTDCHTANIETYEMLYHMANSGAADFCVNLGDYIPTHYDSLADCIALFERVARNYNTIPTKVNVNFLKGNHDNNVVGNSDSSAFVSNADFYNQLEWREKDIVGKTNKAYGYRDISHANIRVIMLDASDIYDTDGTRLSTNGEVQILQPQFEWFVNEALDLSDKDTPTNWQVIILAHASLQTLCVDAFRAVLNAFQSGSSVNGSYTANSAGYSHTLTANKDFTSQGAIRVICTVSGHQHADMIKQLGTTIPISEVYVACENQGAYYFDENNEQVWYTRTRGTILEHCIETICVQRSRNKVVFKRLGIGSDREISY